jgi:ABC-type nitrate/sulfonate/bicarbonate transport system permease component
MRVLITAIGFILLAGAWETYIYLAEPVPTLAPSIADVLRVFTDSPVPVLLATVHTLLAISFSFCVGGLLGTLAGLLFGRHGALDRAIAAPVLFFATIPIVTWVPLLVLWIGVNELPVIACGLIASFFPSFQAGRGAARNPPRDYVEAAKNLGVPEQRLVRTVILPAMLPVLLAGWRSSLQLTFLVLPVAEMLLRRGGLGAMVGRGMDLARADQILFAQLALGALGASVFFGADRIERRSLRWMHGDDSRG